jgi:hypothetical protein
MTQKEAKELTLELWRYLAEHPECYKKNQVPKDLYDRIKRLTYKCPLCSIFWRRGCDRCPLKNAGDQCHVSGSVYDVWSDSGEKAIRKAAAEHIVEIVSTWRPRRNNAIN